MMSYSSKFFSSRLSKQRYSLKTFSVLKIDKLKLIYSLTSKWMEFHKFSDPVFFDTDRKYGNEIHA